MLSILDFYISVNDHKTEEIKLHEKFITNRLIEKLLNS